MLKVNVTGLDMAKARLAGLSDRRLNAALATALTRTAVAVKEEVTQQLPKVFDKPTPYTLKSLFVRPATAQRLEAVTWFKDDMAASQGGTPATKYLLPNVTGGPRNTKRLEAALAAVGALPAGWKVTPGQGARLDAYGNMSRGQVIQVLSQLRIQLVGGFTRATSFEKRSALRAYKKAGGRFFIIPPGGKTQPGIYQREFLGRNVTPVFIFVKGTQYRPRFDFDGMAKRVVEQRLRPEFDRAISEQLTRMGGGK